MANPWHVHGEGTIQHASLVVMEKVVTLTGGLNVHTDILLIRELACVIL